MKKVQKVKERKFCAERSDLKLSNETEIAACLNGIYTMVERFDDRLRDIESYIKKQQRRNMELRETIRFVGQTFALPVVVALIAIIAAHYL